MTTCIETLDVVSGEPCAGGLISTVDYNLPCPSISAFSYSVNAGIIRTSVATGYARQRRLFSDRPTTYDLTWTLTTDQLHAWEAFANKHGYGWHFLPMVTGQCPVWHPSEHPIRYISDWQVDLLTENVWEVVVQAEQYKIDMDCWLCLYQEKLTECLVFEVNLADPVNWIQLHQTAGDAAAWSDPNG